ncbi:MAG TPA: efflux RND transporter periplasmic adaptor subunit [Myxococcaceae bacterium]|nr:efflux RND transporter periplasmic adaptor subunit [Myxococcaceae bacterium]
MRAFSVFILIAAAIAAGCRSEPGAADAGGVPVQVVKVEWRDVADAIIVSGPLDPPPGRDVKLGALVIGRISQILVAEGDRVEAGQLLAQIETTPLRDGVMQAKAALDQAKAQDVNAAGRWDRTLKLFDAGIAAGQEVDDARSQAVVARSAVKTSEAALSTAENLLRRSELRAPFAGLVAHIFAAPGEPVDGTGKPIVEVADTTVLELRGGLAAGQVERIRPHQPAEVRVDGLGNRAFPGEVFAVSPVIDPATGVATVRIRVNNPDGALKGGTLGRAKIIAALHRHVLAIPREALIPLDRSTVSASQSGSIARAFAVERVVNGEASKQPVGLGAMDEQWVEATSGLQEGELVIVQGAYALPDGTRVQIEHPQDGGMTGSATTAGAP